MPKLAAPNFEGAKLSPDVRRVLEASLRPATAALNKALVVGDTLQIFGPIRVTASGGSSVVSATKLAFGTLNAVAAAAFPNGTIISTGPIDCSPYRTILARLLLLGPAPSSNVQLALSHVCVDGSSDANGQYVTPVNSAVGLQKEVLIDASSTLAATSAGMNNQQNLYGGKLILADVRLNAAAGTPAVTGKWDVWGFP